MQPTTINPDQVCRQAIQAKLATYQAKERFETILASYNERVDGLITLITLMRNRIVELENQAQSQGSAGEKPDRKERETVPA